MDDLLFCLLLENLLPVGLLLELDNLLLKLKAALLLDLDLLLDLGLLPPPAGIDLETLESSLLESILLLRGPILLLYGLGSSCNCTPPRAGPWPQRPAPAPAP